MAELMAVYRIMPSEPGAEEGIKSALHSIKSASLKEVRIEPFAFGLNAVIAAFLMQEQEGASEKLEEEIKAIPNVSDVRLEHVSRL